MRADCLSAIRDEFQGMSALEHVYKISGFHRIQASPGYRAAALYVQSSLEKLGIPSEVLTFPAREGASWWSQPGFQEWDCEDAELALVLDGRRERLCSYKEDKLSIIQRSAPTPPGGVEVPIVYIDRADERDSYSGRDVRGKIVFGRGDAGAIARLAVDEFGALGIVVDNMAEFPPVRDRLDLPDARQYTSFWPLRSSDFRAFGFVLTPRQGQALRAKLESSGAGLTASAYVRSRFYDGSIEDVTALIPGETCEEVVAMAHLCHPQPSANDNASGAGTLMEAARTLSRLISEGILKKPRRGIRFLWVPEMTGSYTYLSANEGRLNGCVAALNLDMVGENQDLCKGPFLVERPPKALPGFGGDLAESILRALSKGATNLAGTASYALHKWAIAPFSGGSDHYVWADPTVGVTCPMLIQWPDKYYHTSHDTIDKVDPKMLHLAGTITAAYLYFAATASPEEAAWLGREMAAHFPVELEEALSEVAAKARIEKWELPRARRAMERRASFLASREALDIETLDRLGGTSPGLARAKAESIEYVQKASEFLLGRALSDLAREAGLSGADSLPPAWEPPMTEAETKAASLVPERVFKGPFVMRKLELSPELREANDAFRKKHGPAGRTLTCVQYWADGRRSIADIAECIEGETGQRDIDAIVDYVDLLAKGGAFRLIERQ